MFLFSKFSILLYDNLVFFGLNICLILVFNYEMFVTINVYLEQETRVHTPPRWDSFQSSLRRAWCQWWQTWALFAAVDRLGPCHAVTQAKNQSEKQKHPFIMLFSSSLPFQTVFLVTLTQLTIHRYFSQTSFLKLKYLTFPRTFFFCVYISCLILA